MSERKKKNVLNEPNNSDGCLYYLQLFLYSYSEIRLQGKYNGFPWVRKFSQLQLHVLWPSPSSFYPHLVLGPSYCPRIESYSYPMILNIRRFQGLKSTSYLRLPISSWGKPTPRKSFCPSFPLGKFPHSKLPMDLRGCLNPTPSPCSLPTLN